MTCVDMDVKPPFGGFFYVDHLLTERYFLPCDKIALLSLVCHCDTRRGQEGRPKAFLAFLFGHWALSYFVPP